ncbi:MAG TPA: hypothetical protein VEE84_02255, partial [Burkholderiaceae bacterium]|nr:hypothetical protein [Burkholderiaceae bacterium]
LSALRFDGLEIAQQPWLKGQWHLDVVREAAGGFVKVSAETRDATGLLRFVLTPVAKTQTLDFQMEGRNWTLPFGASFPMEEAIAEGQISPGQLDVKDFSLGGAFGAVRGAVTATFDGVWAIDGTVGSEGLDLAALIRLLAPAPSSSDESGPDADTIVSGNASFFGKFEGKGASLTEAATGAVFAAPVQIRWPVLNGINLGYAATRPGSAAGSGKGSTRFSALSAVVVAGGNTISFRDIRGHAGALTASGQVEMTADHALSGLLHVELGATRVLAPIRVAVHGTLIHPQFGR